VVLDFGGCADGCGWLPLVAKVLAPGEFFIFFLDWAGTSICHLACSNTLVALVSWSVWLSENDREDVPEKRLDCLIEKRVNYASVA